MGEEHKPSGWQCIHLLTIDSTNSWAMERLDSLPHRTAITADTQGAGRGRLDRQWFSPPGLNLYLSVVLKPGSGQRLPHDTRPGCQDQGPGAVDMANVGQVMAVALVETLAGMGVPATIKWPNDVMVQDRKIAGILCESRWAGASMIGCVVGVGLNVNMDASHLEGQPFQGTSLFLETGVGWHLGTVRDLLLGSFDPLYEQFSNEGFQAIAPLWRGASRLTGRWIRVHGPQGVQEGLVEGLDDGGGLILMTAQGVPCRITVGDVEG